MGLFSKFKKKTDKNAIINNSASFSAENNLLNEDELTSISGGLNLTSEELDNKINTVSNITNINK